MVETYQKQVGYFGDYLICEEHKKISLEESKDYIDYLIENGKSLWIINTALAVVCKVPGANIHDYKHSRRTNSKIERGNTETYIIFITCMALIASVLWKVEKN